MQAKQKYEWKKDDRQRISSSSNVIRFVDNNTILVIQKKWNYSRNKYRLENINKLRKK